MPYSERAYFEGDHCAHCAARDEFMRLKRIRENCQRMTNQQLADMALTEWQSARRAAQRGEIDLARGYRREALRLVDLIKGN